MTQEDWWASFYDDTLADLYLVRADAEELEATLDFLTDVLRLAPGSTVFDQCCGIGSLGVPLARRGARVIGVDLCEAYIRRAAKASEALDGACEFHSGDAFEFVPGRACDAAFNWYTSFGYARDDRRNMKMLERAFEALRPGGRFALDYANMASVLNDFKERMVRRGRNGERDLVVVRECSLNLREGMLEQLWTCTTPEGPRLLGRSAVRIYLPHQLAEMLERCGFVDVRLYGGVRREELGIQSPRCICTARRP